MALYDIPDLPVVEEPVSASEMTQYTGVYELSPQFRITVSVKEGKLLVQATNQEAFEIFRERDDLFFLKVVEAKIQFTRDAGGQVTGLILLQNGNEVPGRKL